MVKDEEKIDDDVIADPNAKYHSIIVFDRQRVTDSLKDGLKFDTYEDAMKAGKERAEEIGDIASIRKIKAKKIEIVEFKDEE